MAGERSPAGGSAHGDGSVVDDIQTLLDDGKTYLQAELQFQKSRASFAVARGRSGAVYGVAALMAAHLALIALVVGLVFALSSLIGPWGATAIVFGVLIVAGIVLALAARRRLAAVSSAFREGSK
ncbi:hypothetical protein GCM10011515_10130 [Tsuneonella deserti]|uniref:Phage holin family protein n=1 Tax=Tsuneonella deserti TaxID=2035528 RepID=A0ABQ1S493_9SPHN|nr:hypothetical protein GCM10011515_10130 [Tsuneonella deserti]